MNCQDLSLRPEQSCHLAVCQSFHFHVLNFCEYSVASNTRHCRRNGSISDKHQVRRFRRHEILASHDSTGYGLSDSAHRDVAKLNVTASSPVLRRRPAPTF